MKTEKQVYQDELLDLVKSDKRITANYTIKCIIWGLSYEDFSTVEGRKVSETFDVFLACERETGKTVYVSYGDEGSFRISSLSTVEKHRKNCSM